MGLNKHSKVLKGEFEAGKIRVLIIEGIHAGQRITGSQNLG